MTSFSTPKALFALSLVVAMTTLSESRQADAFCGFYVSGSTEQLTNKATRVALMRYGQRTVLTMSNDYEGPPENFAMVVPVPIVLQEENVRVLPHDIFSRIEQLTAPRLVEYWEQNPCPEPSYGFSGDDLRSVQAAPTGMVMETASAAERPRDLGVRIESRFEVGEYQILILSATQSSGLETWLRQEHYNIPQGAAPLLEPYIREGSKFFVARVNIQRVERRPNGSARLSPLRFHYDTPEFRLPVRLGLLNASDKQDLIMYMLHPTSRIEVANVPNVFIPTNLDVEVSVKQQFGTFYNSLFDMTMARMSQRAVVTEYAWMSTASCDPCPGNNVTLTPADMLSLGVDVIDPARNTADHEYRYGRVQGAPISRFAYGMTVTRLHTRYNAETLRNDLVFREAGAVAGGREHIIDQQTRQLEQGAVPGGGMNNFQARYAVRHLWDGPIQCEQPRRYVWGGAPNQRYDQNQPIAATDLTTQPRSGVNLQQVVQTAVPELGLRGGRHSAQPAAAQSKPVSQNGRQIPQGFAALSAFGIVALLWRVLRIK